MKLVATLALTLACAVLCLPVLAQQSIPGQVDGPLTEDPQYKAKAKTQKASDSVAPPRSDDESSSDQTRLNLSPPKEDSIAHPDGGHEAGDVMELHEWNPMRAMKDVEVGDFYYKEGNYKAALRRYREALQFKPHDGPATFKLAQTLEKTKEFADARIEYEAYLAILKDGPNAAEARKALDRLKKQ